MIKSFQWFCLIFLSMILSAGLACIWFKENVVGKIFISRKRRRKIKKIKLEIELTRQLVAKYQQVVAMLEKELRWLGGK